MQMGFKQMKTMMKSFMQQQMIVADSQQQVIELQIPLREEPLSQSPQEEIPL
jgi:hypothetical protein